MISHLLTGPLAVFCLGAESGSKELQGSKNLYIRWPSILPKSLANAADLAAAPAVLLDPDPYPPRAIRQQAPDLDLHVLVIDRRLHRCAAEVGANAATRVTVALLHHDVHRLIHALARLHTVYQISQIVGSRLGLSAEELLGSLHRARQVDPLRDPVMMTAVVSRQDHHRLIHCRQDQNQEP